MRNLIKQILRLIPTSDKFLKLVHARLSWLFIWFAAYLLTIGPLFTATGHGGVNLIPLFIWVIAWTVAALHPEALAALIVVRLPGSPSKKKMETIKETLADTLPKVFGEIGIWPIIILFYLSVIDASLKPSGTWVIYGGALIIAFYTIRYNKSGKIFKTFSACAAFVVILVTLVKFMEPESQVHWFGFNVLASLSASPFDREVAAKEEEQKKVEDARDIEKLGVILKAEKEGRATPAMKVERERIIQKRNKNTVPNKIFSAFGSVFVNVSEGAKIIRSSFRTETRVASAIVSAPAPAPAPEVQTPAPIATPAVQVQPASQAPRWETVTRQFVEYRHWNRKDLGYITLADLPDGKYIIEVQPADFCQTFLANGNEFCRPIPPEGLAGEYVTYAHELPLRGTAHNYVGARIMKVNDSEPEYIGRGKEFMLNLQQPVSVKVSINMLQDQADQAQESYPVQNNFVKNKGGDWITIKRLAS